MTDQEQRYFKCLSQARRALLTMSSFFAPLTATLANLTPRVTLSLSFYSRCQVNELRDELSRLQQLHDRLSLETKRRLDDKEHKASEIKEVRRAVRLAVAAVGMRAGGRVACPTITSVP